MLALPRHLSQMVSDVLDDDIFYWPLNSLQNRCAGLMSTMNHDTSVPTFKNDKYQMCFDVRNFDPNTVKVKLDGDRLHVSAKQEKKGDGHYEYREFIREVNVPDNVHAEKLTCKMDKDGLLRFEAPLKMIEPPKSAERVIPIEMVGKKQQQQAIEK